MTACRAPSRASPSAASRTPPGPASGPSPGSSDPSGRPGPPAAGPPSTAAASCWLTTSQATPPASRPAAPAGAGARFSTQVAPASRARASTPAITQAGISADSTSASHGAANAAATSSGPARAFAPAATAMVFSPTASTVIRAGPQPGPELVAAAAADHPHRRTQPGGGHRLVGSLAAGADDRAHRRQDRLPRARQVRHGQRDVGVEAAHHGHPHAPPALPPRPGRAPVRHHPARLLLVRHQIAFAGPSGHGPVRLDTAWQQATAGRDQRAAPRPDPAGYPAGQENRSRDGRSRLPRLLIPAEAGIGKPVH